MTSPFEGYEVEAALRPSGKGLGFDLDAVLSSVVALEATVPPDASTANTLGTERVGNGVVIGREGLVLTIGYLLIEASEVTLTTNAGRKVAAHVLGVDPVTGFGLVNALEPLDLEPIALGDSRGVEAGDPVILAGGGGREHAVAARLLARQQFAGYWEYLLDEALFVGPAHPHWSGAALLGPKGELIGIGSLAMEQGDPDGDSTPINMCVPTELLPPILDDLSRGHPAYTPRPWLGVLARDLDPGVVIVGLTEGGPADRAELHAGDRVLAVGGKPVKTLAEFYRRLWAQGQAGANIALRLQREGDEFDVVVRSIDRASTFRKRRFN